MRTPRKSRGEMTPEELELARQKRRDYYDRNSKKLIDHVRDYRVRRIARWTPEEFQAHRDKCNASMRANRARKKLVESNTLSAAPEASDSSTPPPPPPESSRRSSGKGNPTEGHPVRDSKGPPNKSGLPDVSSSSTLPEYPEIPKGPPESKEIPGRAIPEAGDDTLPEGFYDRLLAD